MKPKKHPKQDLNKKSGLYFVWGLLMVLGLAFVALEWKSYDNHHTLQIVMNTPDTSLEAEMVQKFKVEQPPQPKVMPPKIKVEEDDADIDESEVLATDTNQYTEVLEPEDIEVEEFEEEPNVIWETIEEAPIFPGCEQAKDKRACFSEMMQKHIQKNFNYPSLEQELGIQGRVNVLFDINKDGSIGQIQYRGPNANLEKEAVRIISKLPRMTPGKQRGSAVKVAFAIPITFKLQ